MSEPTPPLPPIPPGADPPPAAPLDYRAGPETQSQWITDDHPKHRWFVVLLMLLFPFTLLCGVLESIFGVIRMILRW